MTKSKLDLTKELTVFVIHCEEDMLTECIDSLKNQNCYFTLEYIKNIFPMSKAFQKMPEKCETKYFIQLDGDMVLNNNAILNLYNYIKKSSFNTYRVSGQLYEEGYGVGGHIKCWKKNIFKYFKFNDVRTVDRNFHSRVRIFGFRNKIIIQNFGKHVPRHSNFSNYLKTKSDIEKWRYLKRPYDLYAKELLKKINNTNDIYKLNGFIMGVLSFKKTVIKSKDLSYEKKLYNKIYKIFNIESYNKDIFINMSEHNFYNLTKLTYNFYTKNNLNYKLKLITEFSKNYNLNIKQTSQILNFLKN